MSNIFLIMGDIVGIVFLIVLIMLFILALFDGGILLFPLVVGIVIFIIAWLIVTVGLIVKKLREDLK